MYSIFLIGNIASGKSSAARYFGSRGARVIDLDRACKDMYVPGSPLVDDLVQEFGLSILLPDGSVDRQALADRAFCDSASVAVLNETVHPYIAKYVADILLPSNCCSTLVPEFPLTVVEMSVPEQYSELFPLADEVVAITCDPHVRCERAIARGMTACDVSARMDAQPPEEFLCSMASTVIVNDGSEQELYAKLDAWLSNRGIDVLR